MVPGSGTDQHWRGPQGGRRAAEPKDLVMARRTPATFAKRQREMDKKRWADEKRAKRAERRSAEPRPPGEEPPYEVCRPIVD